MSRQKEMCAEELRMLLETTDWDIMPCDAAVPYFSNGVPAGYPEMPGDYDGEYERVPTALLRICDFIVAVKGDSMRDADICNGDDVIVKKTDDYDDGDIVVACLDGETTLKAVCHSDGEVWLVPANEEYTAFRLSDYMDVYILGKVTSVRKRPRRMPYSDVQRRLAKAQQKMDAHAFSAVTAERVANALKQCSSFIWGNAAYAVAFCVCRDCYDWDDNAADFERLLRAAGIDCPQGTIASAFYNNKYMRMSVDKWKNMKVAKRVLALVEALKTTIKG